MNDAMASVCRNPWFAIYIVFNTIASCTDFRFVNDHPWKDTEVYPIENDLNWIGPRAVGSAIRYCTWRLTATFPARRTVMQSMVVQCSAKRSEAYNIGALVHHIHIFKPIARLLSNGTESCWQNYENIGCTGICSLGEIYLAWILLSIQSAMNGEAWRSNWKTFYFLIRHK